MSRYRRSEHTIQLSCETDTPIVKEKSPDVFASNCEQLTELLNLLNYPFIISILSKYTFYNKLHYNILPLINQYWN